MTVGRQSPTRSLFARLPAVAVALALPLVVGCATTRSSDTPRTATEQLLLSTAIDKAINRLDFRALDETQVYFDPQYLQGVSDEKYVVSALRQHLLASGCMLCEKRDEAEVVIEARSGGVGTDRNELMLGLPAMPVPQMVPGVPMPLPTSVPQMTLARKTKQRAVAKIAVFAYNRETGRPVWQSGTVPMVADTSETWLLGVRPFQRRTLINGLSREGELLLSQDGAPAPRRMRTNEEIFFDRPLLAAGAAGRLQPTEQPPPAEATTPGDAQPPNQGATIGSTADRLAPASKEAADPPSETRPDKPKTALVWRRAQSPPSPLLWWLW